MYYGERELPGATLSFERCATEVRKTEATCQVGGRAIIRVRLMQLIIKPTNINVGIHGIELGAARRKEQIMTCP